LTFPSKRKKLYHHLSHHLSHHLLIIFISKSTINAFVDSIKSQKHLTTAVVVGDTVRAAALEISTLTGSSQSNDSVGDSRRAGETRLKTLEVKSKTNNVRASHGSTRDSLGGSGRANPCGKNVESRTEDVDNTAVVGEVGASVVAADGADGDGRRG
jgi:hypothetical protein